MNKKENVQTDTSVILLRNLLILQLFSMGVPQAQIAKKIGVANATVNAFLKGIKKDAAQTR